MTDHVGLSRLFAEALSVSYDDRARRIHLTFAKPDPKQVFELYAPSLREHYDTSMADAFEGELRHMIASGEIMNAFVKVFMIEPVELMDAVCDELAALEELPRDQEILGSWTVQENGDSFTSTWLVPGWFNETLIQDPPDSEIFLDACKAAFFDL